MTGKRSYDDGYAGAHALDLVGERWALLVVRELLLGPKRFTDLRAGLPGISANVLSQRLIELEQASIVQRRRLPPPFSAWVYELTAWGKELDAVVRELHRWGARSPTLPRDAPLGTDSIVLSLAATFDAAAAAEFATTVELRFGLETFRATIAGGAIAIARGAAAAPDVTIESTPAQLAAIVYDGASAARALRDGSVRVAGDKAAFKRFLSLFARPSPAAATWPGA